MRTWTWAFDSVNQRSSALDLGPGAHLDMTVSKCRMVKLLFCLRRREGMDLEAFQRYWRDTHAPLVQQHAATFGIVRYVQTHTRPSPEANAVRAWDEP